MSSKIFRFLCQIVFLILVASTSVFAQQARPILIEEADVVLIGGGIMSATLANLLHELDPTLKIKIYEQLPNLAFESSGSLNNAGTGHAALSELNYTPQKPDGSIDISKAIQINEEFELSKQFWSYLAANGKLGRPSEFINSVPHMSWVHGEENVKFLRKRFEALKQISLFQDMEYTEDTAVLKKWMPVVMQNRMGTEPMAATRSFLGTDVDYGRLTTLLFENLVNRGGAEAFVSHRVETLKQDSAGQWRLGIQDLSTKQTRQVRAKFVFIGAGGGTLPLLQKSGVSEANGYGGFPIGGDFLIYKGTNLSEQHMGKIYGQAPVGAPPMSVPHLDTRIIDGQKRLIFGPFAGATTRFLKNGSLLDLAGSLRLKNMGSMLEAGFQNLNLVKYLLQQESMSHEDHMQALREFVPQANSQEWELIHAGVRVQIIKHVKGQGNVLRFGTEVLSTSDGTLSAILGASPGASISVAAMLQVLLQNFKSKLQLQSSQSKLKEMVPSFGKRLMDDSAFMNAVRSQTHQNLSLHAFTCARFFGAL